MDKKIVVPGSLDRIKHEGELLHPDEVSPLAKFMTESLRLRRAAKKEIVADLNAIEGELVDKGVEVRVIPDHLVMLEPNLGYSWPVHVSGPGIAAARHPSDREPIEWDFFVEPGMQFTRGKERLKPIRKLDDAWAAPYEVHKNFFDIWTAPKSDFFDRWAGPASYSYGEIGAGSPISRGWYFMPLYWPDIKLLYSYLELEEALRYGHGRWMASRVIEQADWHERMAKWSNERREINTMFAWGHHVIDKKLNGKKDH